MSFRIAPIFLCLLPQIATSLTAESIPIHGHVTDRQGEPLAGIRVELHPEVSQYQLGVQWLMQEESPPLALDFSDSQGEFHLKAPGEGFWRVEVHGQGFVPMSLAGWKPLWEEAHLPAVPLVQDVGAFITVTDDLGEPLSGAAVAAFSSSPLWQEIQQQTGWAVAPRQALSSPTGQARIARAAGERLNCFAFRQGRLESNFSSQASEFEIALFPGVFRTIQVLDPQGNPVPGALVRTGRWPQGVTGRDGRLSLAVDAQSPIGLRVFLPDRREKEGVFQLDAQSASLAIELDALDFVSGTVVERRSGRPVSGALVWWSGDWGIQLRTDLLGRFRTIRPSKRHLRLLAAADGYLTGAYLPGDGPNEAASILIEPSFSIAGRAVDAQGAPLPGARVQYRDEYQFDNPWPASTRENKPIFTLSDGRFFLNQLASDRRYEIQVLRDGYAPAVALVDPDSGPSELRLVLKQRIAAISCQLAVGGCQSPAQKGDPEPGNLIDPFSPSSIPILPPPAAPSLLCYF